jgi:hypothetical protein
MREKGKLDRSSPQKSSVSPALSPLETPRAFRPDAGHWQKLKDAL